MTRTSAPFDALTDHLALRSRGPSAAAAVRRFAAAGAPVGALADPLAVALACHDPSRPTDARRTVAALAALAPHDELAALTGRFVLEDRRPAPPTGCWPPPGTPGCSPTGSSPWWSPPSWRAARSPPWRPTAGRRPPPCGTAGPGPRPGCAPSPLRRPAAGEPLGARR